MGISGLLPLLKETQEAVHVSKYAGKVVGIDAYVWLHRGAYGCAEALALGRQTQSYINYAMTKVKMLQDHGVKPFLVFDGGHLPAKAKTEDERAQRREQSIARARELVAKGRKKEAREYYTRCIDVTPEMAYQLIKALRKAGVPYIVAAYEADAQLAYLERTHVIDAIITEDSDLLVFGCKTVLYKLDSDGYCMELKQDKRHLCKALNLQGFGDDLFRQMAILSGCDYLASIPGLGLKKSFILLKKHQTVARVLAAVRMDGMRVPDGYQESFSRAERTFVYQRVFARQSDGTVQLVTLTEPATPDLIRDSDDYVGPVMTDELAEGIANGDINPITRQLIVDLMPSSSERPSAPTPESGLLRPTNGNSFYRQKSNAKASPAVREAGQRGLDTFFSRSASNTGATPRRPLMDKSNMASKSVSNLDALKMESEMAGLQPTQTASGSSKYFADARTDLSQVATPARKKSTQLAKLASFTPDIHLKRSPSHVSSDGDIVSSPASERKNIGQSDILMTSPQGDDHVASSPCTSPTHDTKASIHSSKTSVESLTGKRKRGAELDDDDDDSDVHCTGISLKTKQLFEQWRYDENTTVTPSFPLQKMHAPIDTRRSSDSPLAFRQRSPTVTSTATSSTARNTSIDVSTTVKSSKSSSPDENIDRPAAKLIRRSALTALDGNTSIDTPTGGNKFAAFAFNRTSARKSTLSTPSDLKTPVPKRTVSDTLSVTRSINSTSSSRRLQFN